MEEIHPLIVRAGLPITAFACKVQLDEWEFLRFVLTNAGHRQFVTRFLLMHSLNRMWLFQLK